MENIVKIRWQSWGADSTEDLSLRETKEGIFVESNIISRGKEHFTAKYTIDCDTSWRVRKLKLALIETGRKIELSSNGSGEWQDDSGFLPQLNGAIDIDISATPFTNTLPICRLKLDAGQSTNISVVYITVPNLDVSLERQKYTCLIPNKRYRFESLDSGFVREIEVDEHGLVLVYPDLFKRI